MGFFGPNNAEMMKMVSIHPVFVGNAFMFPISHYFIQFNYFDTGQYVPDLELQEKCCGPAPAPEDVVGRYLEGLHLEEKM